MTARNRVQINEAHVPARRLSRRDAEILFSESFDGTAHEVALEHQVYLTVAGKGVFLRDDHLVYLEHRVAVPGCLEHVILGEAQSVYGKVGVQVELLDTVDLVADHV